MIHAIKRHHACNTDAADIDKIFSRSHCVRQPHCILLSTKPGHRHHSGDSAPGFLSPIVLFRNYNITCETSDYFIVIRAQALTHIRHKERQRRVCLINSCANFFKAYRDIGGHLINYSDGQSKFLLTVKRMSIAPHGSIISVELCQCLLKPS